MKKILSALLILTSLLFHFVACDYWQNCSSTTENMLESSTVDSERKSTDTIPSYPPSENPPIANCDISNYQGIVDLFRNIVNYYPSYTEAKMLSNECDGVEFIAEKETQELYKSLFISGYRFYLEEYAYKYLEDGRNFFGYSITDLNQNGSNELILLTDLYNIVAVFSMEEAQPKLLLDNFERNYDYRIDNVGRIYAQKNTRGSSNTLYTQIYSLNEHDALNLEEEYFCIDYNNVNEKQCYAVINGEEIQISISEWKELSHGWVYGHTSGIITKTNAQFDFIRLFGELNLYLPDIYSWGCYSSQFDPDENILFISNLSDTAVSVELYDATVLYQRKVFVQAMLVGNTAIFETEEISGRLQFGLDSIWLTIENSNLSSVPCGTFLYTKFSYGKG